MRIQRSLLLMAVIIFSCFAAYSIQGTAKINNFIVKENLINNGKLAVIACDSADRPLEGVNGTFRFVLNGFQQDLKFNDGVAVAPLPIATSVFVFLKHKNEAGSHGKLYYVLKKDDGSLNPIEINWLWLIAIPLGIVLVIYMFKRFLIIGLLILAGLFYFNYNKGLNLENLFETIFHGIRGLF